MSKSILLGMPDHVGVYCCIKKNLEYHGFKVTEAIITGDKINYQFPRGSSLLSRVINQFKRNPVYDYAIFIRSDLFVPSGFLAKIRPHVKNDMIGYQWDYMDRFPLAWDAVSFFDRFFVFDSADYKENTTKFLPLTNFYFDYQLETSHCPITDFYFIGCHVDGRECEINLFAETAERNGLSLDFEIVAPSEDHVQDWKKLYPHENIRIGTRFKSFQENLDNLRNSRILVDFKTPSQEGLSFRSFEALGCRKKLITTNSNIKNYDFYHPNNIFIWDGRNIDGLQVFLDLPYIEIDERIREKYSFKNWINYILNIMPNQKIALPE